jgi:hypothetical protein
MAVYFVLKLNVFPVIGGREHARGYLVALFCGVAALNLYVYHDQVRRGYEDDLVSPTEKLLQELHKDLPLGGHVGFIGDGKKRPPHSSMERFFLTQYEMAPIVVEEGTAADFVIVNVEKFSPGLIPDNLILVRDFGSGLMLFGKSHK